MKKIFTFIISLLFLPVRAEMISSTNFEGFQQGTPMSRELFQEKGFQTGTWDNSLSTRTIIDSTQSFSGLQSMRIMYPKNGFGPEETGCQVQLKFTKRDEAFVSYCLRFSENFSWGTTSYGGKLPGLCGGANCSGGETCDGTNGFSARLMWREGGKAILYLYHMDKPDQYGEIYELLYPNGSQVVFNRGEWYHVAERVKINTDGSTYDGEVEIWINGLQVLLVKGLRFTSNGDKVDNFYISTFHGGDDETWCPTETCYTWLDDIRIGTTYQDVSYQSCRKPEIGENQSLCTGAKSYSFAPDFTSEKVNYQWVWNGKRISTESSILVWNEGRYVLIADSAWCSRKDTAYLLPTVHPNLGEDKHICNSSFVELNTQLTNDTMAYSFEWSRNGVVLNERTNKIRVKDAGRYTVKVLAGQCPTDSDYIDVTSGLLEIKENADEQNTKFYIENAREDGIYNWYNDEELQDLYFTGPCLIMPSTLSSRYLYVKEENSISALVGKKKLTTNAWTRSDFSESMLFTVMKTLTIDSLSIYPKADLTAVIRIIDDKTGELVSSQTYKNLSPGENRLPINVTLKPGNYKMNADGTTAPLYHSHDDDDIKFPYLIENVISINGSDKEWMNEKAWYLYFYNWRITVGNVCAATPVYFHGKELTFRSDIRQNKIDVYPKYTDGELNIDGIEGKAKVSVFSSNGKKIFSVKCRQSHLYLNVGKLKSGPYLLVVENQQGRFVTRFMKF